jgi:hypothetical protein
MGRRSRARERAAAAGAARPEPAAPARGRAGWLRALNPFKLRGLDRARARNGAVGFGLAALLFVVVGLVTGRAAWFSSAVLLAILALVWGATAVLLGRVDRSG